ncbi:hypothetical protein DFH07DRAFT_776655 [Mycena maculata]|uniref:Uncharacterized protein n=1 Tax=Mycena maculata TaxID=230809 RepID=A0AAD7N4T5_9AGAR|nr:hypothetical protein DFH07DRAFT_776655 [Mycena maculata]
MYRLCNRVGIFGAISTLVESVPIDFVSSVELDISGIPELPPFTSILPGPRIRTNLTLVATDFDVLVRTRWLKFVKVAYGVRTMLAWDRCALQSAKQWHLKGNMAEVMPATALKYKQLHFKQGELVLMATVLNTVQRRGKVNVNVMDLEEGDDNPDKTSTVLTRKSPDKRLGWAEFGIKPILVGPNMRQCDSVTCVTAPIFCNTGPVFHPIISGEWSPVFNLTTGAMLKRMVWTVWLNQR